MANNKIRWNPEISFFLACTPSPIHLIEMDFHGTKKGIWEALKLTRIRPFIMD